MDEGFDIPVTYKGKELLFKAELLAYGYSHKIKVMVDGRELLFEPDEERNYRVILDPSIKDEGKAIDVELLKTIAAALEEILK